MYTKKRYLLHKKIINMIETPQSHPKKGNKPIAILIGGGAASGKTTLRKYIENELKEKSINITVVDFDEIKKYIPEYNDYIKNDSDQAATLVHKESYDIGMLLLNKLMKCKKSFVFEGTMARTNKYKFLASKLKQLGYEIVVYIVDVPLQVAIVRAAERAKITGRNVPEKVINNTHQLVPKTFLAIKDIVDSYYIYDNQTSLVLIASNNFVDPQKYREFLLKGEIKSHNVD